MRSTTDTTKVRVLYPSLKDAELPRSEDSREIERQLGELKESALISELKSFSKTPEESKKLFPFPDANMICTELPATRDPSSCRPVTVKEGCFGKVLDKREKNAPKYLLLEPGEHQIGPEFELIDIVEMTKDHISHGPIHLIDVKQGEFVCLEQTHYQYTLTYIENGHDDNTRRTGLLKKLPPNTFECIRFVESGIEYRVIGVDTQEKRGTILWSELDALSVARPGSTKEIVENHLRWSPILLELASKRRGHIETDIIFLTPGFHSIYLNKPTHIERVQPPLSGGVIKIKEGENKRDLFAIVPSGMVMIGLVTPDDRYQTQPYILSRGIHYIEPLATYCGQISINEQKRAFLLTANVPHSRSTPVDVDINLTVEFRIKGVFHLLANLEVCDPGKVYEWFDGKIKQTALPYITSKTFDQLTTNGDDVSQTIRNLLMADLKFKHYIEINRLSVEVSPAASCREQLVNETVADVRRLIAQLEQSELRKWREAMQNPEQLKKMTRVFGTTARAEHAIQMFNDAYGITPPEVLPAPPEQKLERAPSPAVDEVLPPEQDPTPRRRTCSIS